MVLKNNVTGNTWKVFETKSFYSLSLITGWQRLGAWICHQWWT